MDMNGKPSRASDDGDVIAEGATKAVPNAATLTNRYEYSGSVAERDEGRATTVVFDEAAGSHGFSASDAGQMTEEAFDVRSPAVAPGTDARQNAEIWGS